jgi:branched-chain amino acid transport system substrate-binding protein
LQAIGESYVAGLKAEAKILNRSGGVRGHQIKVTALDDAGDSTRAVAAAKKLIEDDHAKFIVPDILDPDVVAIMPYTTSAKVLTITGQGASDVVNGKWPYEFQYDLPYESYAPAAAIALKRAGVARGKIAVIDSTAGSYKYIFRAYDKLSSYGYSVVDHETFSDDATDVTPQLAKIKNSGADALITATPGASLGTLYRGVKALDMNLPIIGNVQTTTSLDLNSLIPKDYQKEFSATTFAVLARTGASLSHGLQKWATALKSYGKVDSLLAPSAAADQLKLAVWAYKRVGFNADGAAAAKQLEQLQHRSLPRDFLRTVGNPRWTSSDHSDKLADYTHAAGIIHVGPNILGTYPGKKIVLSK